MKQSDIILNAMLTNKDKQWWSAKDFQSGEHFVGYEATARMSELIDKYDDLILVGKDGRFRILSINWNSEQVEEQTKRLNNIVNLLKA